jgi:hypothetical protein
LVKVAVLRLLARLSPHAAQVQRLRATLERYRAESRTTNPRRRRP